mmetsp:Transcript_9382/g.30600  ORF Transcript_9382/g.30600 Transcript_9382/m.30600 type:complete len:391 (-) Transcript_9382:490-1662(-)
MGFHLGGSEVSESEILLLLRRKGRKKGLPVQVAVLHLLRDAPRWRVGRFYLGRLAVPKDRPRNRFENRLGPRRRVRSASSDEIANGLLGPRPGRRVGPEDGCFMDLGLRRERPVHGRRQRRLHVGLGVDRLRLGLDLPPHQFFRRRLRLHAPDHLQLTFSGLLLPRHPANQVPPDHAAIGYLRHPRHRRRRRLRIHRRLEAVRGQVPRRGRFAKTHRLLLLPGLPVDLQHVVHHRRGLPRDGHLAAAAHLLLRNLRRPLRHHELRPRPYGHTRHRRHRPPTLPPAQAQEQTTARARRGKKKKQRRRQRRRRKWLRGRNRAEPPPAAHAARDESRHLHSVPAFVPADRDVPPLILQRDDERRRRRRRPAPPAPEFMSSSQLYHGGWITARV